ncbi:MAG: bifunctional riboflavin kinase/FMN adenylyltransferase [Bacteroidales bacterium]|nr:bifunctional riboflavin kinase/FMN adenylyltransferase [Bacteroidales bacterium]
MAVIATGFFDGVHPGHRLVIDTLLSEARARGEQSVVVTFWPHPRAVLQSDAASLRYLTSQSEKMEILRGLGVDSVVTVPFTRRFASLSARGYLEMLQRDYGCTEVVLGYDTRFGSEQAGPEEIAALAPSVGLDAVVTEPVCIDGAPVSSSRIRAALEEGDVACAARLLGRPYRLSGVVVSGNRLGRTIGFPTANMKLYEPLMLIPKNGVFRTSVSLPSQTDTIIPLHPQGTGEESPENAALPLGRPSASESLSSPASSSVMPDLLGHPLVGMTNIGIRPTVSDQKLLTIETYILDFDEMIYGLPITVDFLSRIRDERRFGSLDELRSQLCADAALIRG